MARSWIDLVASLVALALVTLALFGTGPGRRYVARLRQHRVRNPLAAAVAVGVGAFLASSLIWLLGGDGSRSSVQLLDGAILAGGAGALTFLVCRNPPDGRG